MNVERLLLIFMSMTFSADEDFACQLDAEDPLRHFRERFHLPLNADGKPFIYLAGNSLGLMPKSARQIVEQELDDWAKLFEVDIFSEPRGMLISDLLSHVSRGYTRSDKSTVGPKRIWSFSDLIECLTTSGDVANNFRPDTVRSIRQRLEI